MKKSKLFYILCVLLAIAALSASVAGCVRPGTNSGKSADANTDQSANTGTGSEAEKPAEEDPTAEGSVEKPEAETPTIEGSAANPDFELYVKCVSEMENYPLNFLRLGFDDLDFDGKPEILFFCHGGGSAGGYLSIGYMEGNSIKLLKDYEDDIAYVPTESFLIKDAAEKKTYFVKEMWQFDGKFEASYGMVNTVEYVGGAPSLVPRLKITGRYDSAKFGFGYEYIDMEWGENDYLKDEKVREALTPQQYIEGEWVRISPEDYLRQKEEIKAKTGTLQRIYGADIFVEIVDNPFSLPSEGKTEFIKSKLEPDKLELAWEKWRESQKD